MEAKPPTRAALRLVAMAGGVLLTITLLAATVRLLLRSDPPAAVASAGPVAEPPGWTLDPNESYRLPAELAEAADPPPEAAAPRSEPSWEASADVTPEPTETLAATPDPSGWRGPLTIHNPAAYGPPEDDSLPPAPTPPSRPAERLAMRGPVGPLLSPEAIHESVADDENDALWVEGVPETTAEPSGAEELSPKIVAALENRLPAPLRDLPTADDEELLHYTVAVNGLSRRLSPEVQAGFRLGKAGAAFAARAKFVGVLRQIALAKDAEAGNTGHATALAEGLRTLDEADDFIPRGDALEAELDVDAIARSHGVRLVGEGVTPHEAVARYSRHAAAKLAEAAGGEQAGSMALYGLGKTYARMDAQHGDDTAGRKSTVLFQAAVDAHAKNYLAANELGVGLARAGRIEQAAAVLRTAASQPGAIATVHANLAAVERRLGNEPIALAAMQASQALAASEQTAGEVSRRHGIEWVSPEAFGSPAPTMASRERERPELLGNATVAPIAVGAPHAPGADAFGSPAGFAPVGAPPAGESAFGRWFRQAKEATGWSQPASQPTPVAYPQAPPYQAAAPQRVLR